MAFKDCSALPKVTHYNQLVAHNFCSVVLRSAEEIALHLVKHKATKTT